MGGVISIETKTNPEKEQFTVGMANGKFETLRNGETNIFLSEPELFLASQDAAKRWDQHFSLRAWDFLSLTRCQEGIKKTCVNWLKFCKMHIPQSTIHLPSQWRHQLQATYKAPKNILQNSSKRKNEHSKLNCLPFPSCPSSDSDNTLYITLNTISKSFSINLEHAVLIIPWTMSI